MYTYIHIYIYIYIYIYTYIYTSGTRAQDHTQHFKNAFSQHGDAIWLALFL